MTARRSQPHYLNLADEQVFTLHYPAAETSSEAIIFCPPAPQETMRSQAALGQLAKRLQDEGHTVIRFDYRGTGDSTGASDSMCLDQWLEDILKVGAWARDELGSRRISLLGLRLGAALAIRASCKMEVDRLVLWDPILDGLNYLRDMEASHKRMFQLNAIEPPFASWRYGKDQCWGFPWTESWRAQLAAISPAMLTPQAADVQIVLGATDPLVRDVSLGWEKLGVKCQLQHVGEPMHWGDERFVKIRAFPAPHLRRIQALWEVAKDE